MEVDLRNKKVVITGSSKGIGLEIAKRFHEEGCKIITNGRNEVDLQKSFNELSECEYIVSDVSDPRQAELFIKEAANKLNGIDILICNVGNGKSVNPGHENYSEWQKVFSKNFYSTTNCVEHAKPYLSKGKGSIVCISSICGSQVIEGAPTTYTVAKAALNAYVKSISKPLATNGIRINAILPGNILFKGSTWDEKMQNDPKLVKSMLEKSVPLKRFGKPSEIANLALYLSSDNANFVTGSIWQIDGGQITSI